MPELRVLTKGRRVLAGLVGAVLLASAPPVYAGSASHPKPVRTTERSAPAGAQVGFAAGETTTSCNSTDPSFCPRNTANYTPAVWSVLRDTHAALDLNIEY